MLTANARKLRPEPAPMVRIKKTKKVVINKKKIRRFFLIVGLIIFLTIINAIVQAFLAQIQFHLEEVRTEIKQADQRIGWLQCEVAERISLQKIERFALENKELFYDNGITNKNISKLNYSQNPIVPPSVLVLDSNLDSKEGNVAEKLTHWLSGLGRTLAGVDIFD